MTMNIMPNISRSKGNQTTKFVLLIEYNQRNIFFKNHAENETGWLKKGGLFSNFVLYSKGGYLSITRFDIIIFCNIQKFELKVMVFSSIFWLKPRWNKYKLQIEKDEIAYSMTLNIKKDDADGA